MAGTIDFDQLAGRLGAAPKEYGSLNTDLE